MKLSGNTILITGGASGIGFAFAERFIKAGNKVIVVGRRMDKLQEAKEKYPELEIRGCDVSVEEDRLKLVEWVTREFPELNMLVNNAGVQQRINLLHPSNEWSYYQKEIAINVEGPIHLSMLFIPHLIKQKEAVIINVTSGLAVMPAVWAPIYSATKAAMRSFTLTMREQLKNKSVEVVEVLPPAVNTDLGGPGLHTFGAPLDDFADEIFRGFENGAIEIGYRGSEKRIGAPREEIDHGMKMAWQNFLKNNPNFFQE